MRAKEVIRHFIDYGTFHPEDFSIMAYLLEKQLPEKPYRRKLHYGSFREIEIVQCPECKRRLRTSKTTKNGDNYCPDCGQAIDWGKNER